MFINLCSKDTIEADLSNVVLAFDVLNLILEFSNNTVEELRIKEAYSIARGNNPFDNNIKIDIKFKVHGSTLEIPFAYSCVNGQQTSLLLREINDLAKNKDIKNSIDFMELEDNAENYIGFVETAYLLQCKTTKGNIYEYSVGMKIENGVLILSKVHESRNLFDEMATEANKKFEKNIVQHSINPF